MSDNQYYVSCKHSSFQFAPFWKDWQILAEKASLDRCEVIVANHYPREPIISRSTKRTGIIRLTREILPKWSCEESDNWKAYREGRWAKHYVHYKIEPVRS